MIVYQIFREVTQKSYGLAQHKPHFVLMKRIEEQVLVEVKGRNSNYPRQKVVGLNTTLVLMQDQKMPFAR